jgi:hypothetical protein
VLACYSFSAISGEVIVRKSVRGIIIASSMMFVSNQPRDSNSQDSSFRPDTSVRVDPLIQADAPPVSDPSQTETSRLREQLAELRKENHSLRQEITRLRAERNKAASPSPRSNDRNETNRSEQNVPVELADLRRQVLQLRSIAAPKLKHAELFSVGFIDGTHPLLTHRDDYIVIDHETLGPIAIAGVVVMDSVENQVRATDNPGRVASQVTAVRIGQPAKPRLINTLLPCVVVGRVPVVDLPNEETFKIPLLRPAWAY